MNRHKVAMGEDLFIIAELYYGDWPLWELIYDVNREQIGDNPELLEPGMELIVPELPNGKVIRENGEEFD